MEEQDTKHRYQDAQSWLDSQLRQGRAFLVLVAPCKAKAVSSAHQSCWTDTEALASARGLQSLPGLALASSTMSQQNTGPSQASPSYLAACSCRGRACLPDRKSMCL